MRAQRKTDSTNKHIEEQLSFMMRPLSRHQKERLLLKVESFLKDECANEVIDRLMKVQNENKNLQHQIELLRGALERSYASEARVKAILSEERAAKEMLVVRLEKVKKPSAAHVIEPIPTLKESEIRAVILKFFEDGKTATTKEIAIHVSRREATAYIHLMRLQAEGKLRKIKEKRSETAWLLSPSPMDEPMPPIMRRIYDILTQQDQPITSTDLAAIARRHRHVIDRWMLALEARGLAKRSGACRSIFWQAAQYASN